MRNPLDLSSSTSAAGMDANEAVGLSCRSEAEVSEEEEESLRRWADAERRRNMGKREEPTFEFVVLSGTMESGFESSDVFRDPEGVLEGLMANTGTSVKCSEGIRI